MNTIKVSDFYRLSKNPHAERLSKHRDKLMAYLEVGYDAAEGLLCGEFNGRDSSDRQYILIIQTMAALDCGLQLEFPIC